MFHRSLQLQCTNDVSEEPAITIRNLTFELVFYVDLQNVSKSPFTTL